MIAFGRRSQRNLGPSVWSLYLCLENRLHPTRNLLDDFAHYFQILRKLVHLYLDLHQIARALRTAERIHHLAGSPKLIVHTCQSLAKRIESRSLGQSVYALIEMG